MGIRNMLNNYYYGKQGKADFTVADLPANRRELFSAVFRVRWAQLAGVNLLYLLFWIPAIAWSSLNLTTLYGMLSTEGVTPEDVSGVVMTWLLILAPCVAITGPFNAGATYVLRNWARDEHSFIWSDFWDAVKGNWKQALAVSAVSGVMLPLVYVGTYFYMAQMRQSILFVMPFGLVLLVGMLWSLSTMVMYDMMVTYDLKLKDVIRNSLLLTMGRFPFALLFKLITLIVPILAFLVLWFVPTSLGYVVLVVSVLYMFYMLAFNKLVTVSYANWLCETFMNTRIEGAPTNIGLRPENWDDVEYRPEDDEE